MILFFSRFWQRVAGNKNQRRIPAVFVLLLIPALLTACGDPNGTAPSVKGLSNSLHCDDPGVRASLPPELEYAIVDKYPHPRSAFTQGLFFNEGVVYESTGLYGQSVLMAYKLGSSSMLNRIALAEKYFGEGATLFRSEILQLTWKSGKVFRYRANDFSLIKEQEITGEGWGITHDGESIITSNGTSTLSFRDPDSLTITKELVARYAGRPLDKLNELEWTGDCLLANIWLTDSIAVINPDSGQVTATINVQQLAAPEKAANPNHVSNGIAYRTDNGNVLITGKNWQWLYEVTLISNAQ